MNGPPLGRTFVRLSLMRQLMLLMGGILLLGMTALWLVGSSALHAHALERARGIAVMTDAIGSWSSQYRGVWVLSDPTDPGVSIGEALDHRQARTAEAPATESRTTAGPGEVRGTMNIARTAATFHRKVPSTVQRELSDLLSRLSSGERVRITNDAPLDARHAPNRFEQTAIARLRRGDASGDEYYEAGDGQLLYARRLSTRADCLRCHAASDATPLAMRTRFGSSPGWADVRDGAFGGIVSVSVPLAPNASSDGRAGWGGIAWTFLLAWAAALAVLIAWLQRRVIRAATSLETYAQCLLAATEDVRGSRVIVDSDEIASRNEMHRVSMALKAVHRELRVAHQRQHEAAAAGGTGAPP